MPFCFCVSVLEYKQKVAKVIFTADDEMVSWLRCALRTCSALPCPALPCPAVLSAFACVFASVQCIHTSSCSQVPRLGPPVLQ